MPPSAIPSKRPLDSIQPATNPEDQSLKTLLAVMTDEQCQSPFTDSSDLKDQDAPFSALRRLLQNYSAPSDENSVGKSLLCGRSTPPSICTQTPGLPLEILTSTASPCFEDCGQACPAGEECSQTDQCWDPDCSVDACGDTHPSTTACADPDCSIPAFANAPCDDPDCDQLFAAGFDVPCFDTECMDGEPVNWTDHDPPQVCPPGNCYGFVDYNQQCLATSGVTQPADITVGHQHNCFHPSVLHNQHHHSGQQAYSITGYQPFYYHCGNHNHLPNTGPHYHNPYQYQPIFFQGSTNYTPEIQQVPTIQQATTSKISETYTTTQDRRKRRRKSLTNNDDISDGRAGVRHGRSHSNACLDHAQLDTTLQALRNAGYGLTLDDSYADINTHNSNHDPSSGILTPSSTSTNIGEAATPLSLCYHTAPHLPVSNSFPYANSIRYQPTSYSLDQAQLTTNHYAHATTLALPTIGNFPAPSIPTAPSKNLPCKWLIKQDDQDEASGPHLCGLLFPNEKALHEHINEHHVPQRTNAYFCCWEGCTRQENDFNHRTKLMRHIKGSHSKWHEYICTHIDPIPNPSPKNPQPTIPQPCNRTFATKEQYENHLNTHTGTKPFKCPWPGCTHTSATKTQQSTHYRTHTGEKKFVCGVCGHGTGDSSNLSKHVRTRHPEVFFAEKGKNGEGMGMGKEGGRAGKVKGGLKGRGKGKGK